MNVVASNQNSREQLFSRIGLLTKKSMNENRQVSVKELCHERLGDKFAEALSDYDTQRRVQVLVDDFLTNEMVAGRSVLDVGCGLGHFSERLQQRNAHVLACDIGPDLVERTRIRAGCDGVVADALNLTQSFGVERFDVVVSSECIEHTPDPLRAVQQMIQVLKPGGYLSLSTPNILWYPVVKLATSLKLRPFDGYEKFSSWGGLRGAIRREGSEVLREHGLHLFPFQLGFHGLSTWLDGCAQSLRPLMINVCLLCQKQ